jgi:hypothetical protein
MAVLLGILVVVALVVASIALFASGHTLLGFVALMGAIPFGVIAGLAKTSSR